MIRATRVLPAHSWDAESATGSVTLPMAERHRRRIRLETDQGGAVLLDLPDAVMLNHGDGLALEDGGTLRVIAAAEDVAEIGCADAVHLARVAWHLGNRHLPLQVVDNRTLRIGWDHVIAAMVEGLGASVTRKTQPFQPEGGAYSGGGHGHSHSHDEGGHAHA
ncbi:Urease accessory protein UreE [Caenispirillum salinarum AK4]|uniref:Urease accessory protein UreE n=1 Tax=Caenispirillum salinarum AK4 TaxID=1238182 RepID=K9GQN6_9PROT|nr:urease accessory protein UreE [Caenispirillum salinarum]EKV27487.1 Urease accessory protein UreE [Caenispirillum salinarum AK4]